MNYIYLSIYLFIFPFFRYVFLLLVLVASLGKIVQAKFTAIPHQPYVTFPQETVMVGVFPEGHYSHI